MANMFALIDTMENAASSTYRLVLDRYPKNAKLLKSYGRFLENVKNDPWGAAKYYAEAEKQVGHRPAALSCASRRALQQRDCAISGPQASATLGCSRQEPTARRAARCRRN